MGLGDFSFSLVIYSDYTARILSIQSHQNIDFDRRQPGIETSQNGGIMWTSFDARSASDCIFESLFSSLSPG
jgi:hypothetical protein